MDAIAKLGKAAGFEKITPIMLSKRNGMIEEKLLNLLLKKVPKEWNTGIILQIHKKKDVREYQSYRSIPSQIFARIREWRPKDQLWNSLEETQNNLEVHVYIKKKNRDGHKKIYTYRFRRLRKCYKCMDSMDE